MIKLTGESLTIDEVVGVAYHDEPVAPLSDFEQQRMQESQAWIQDSIRKKRLIYGINTGFGPLATTGIPAEQASELSRNVILACLTGVGPPLSREMVRAMMIIRANTLTKGHSGVRPVVVQTFIDMLNAGVTPVIPWKGSLGASGDLAPLAHLAVVLTRASNTESQDYSGEAWFDGERLSGAEAMERAGISRLVPQAKEGLALTNGTALMVAAGVLAVFEAASLLAHAEIAAAMSLEGLTALSAALHPSLNEVNCMMGRFRMLTACVASLRYWGPCGRH
jgi:histidine ammonia-lyase